MRLLGCKRKISTVSSAGFIPVAARTASVDIPISTAFTVLPSPLGPWPTSVTAAKQEPTTPGQRRRTNQQGLGPAPDQRGLDFNGGHEVPSSEPAELGTPQWAGSTSRPYSRFGFGGEGRFRTVSASRPKPRLRDTLSRSLTQGLFLDQQAAHKRLSVDAQRPTVRVGFRRPASLPGRLSQTYCSTCEKLHASACPPPAAGVAACGGPGQAGGDDKTLTSGVEASSSADRGHHLSTRGAVLLLLVSTVLVAYCAELMVGAISEMLAMPSSPVGEAFIGLIVLPIVGNAAEHVTAITGALKNKLDLAIAVSVSLCSIFRPPLPAARTESLTLD